MVRYELSTSYQRFRYSIRFTTFSHERIKRLFTSVSVRRRGSVGLSIERVSRTRSSAWDPRRVLRAAQTSRKKLEGRADAYRLHLLSLSLFTQLLLDISAKTVTLMGIRRPCVHREVSFDSGTLDSNPAYIKCRPTRFIPDHGIRYPVVIGF